MTAERLREAAALMRSRAEACRPVSWVQNGRNGIHTPVGECVATTHCSDDAARKAEAEHIASWHPAVALAGRAWDGVHRRGTGAARSDRPPQARRAGVDRLRQRLPRVRVVNPPTTSIARGQIWLTRDDVSIPLTVDEVPAVVAALLAEADRLEDAL